MSLQSREKDETRCKDLPSLRGASLQASKMQTKRMKVCFIYKVSSAPNADIILDESYAKYNTAYLSPLNEDSRQKTKGSSCNVFLNFEVFIIQ